MEPSLETELELFYIITNNNREVPDEIIPCLFQLLPSKNSHLNESLKE